MTHPLTLETAHILLVEDNEATRYTVNRVLRNAGCRVSLAENGEQGIFLARTTSPDLVLLDVQLPDISGFEVVRRLKADPATAEVPVVHLSASHVGSEDRIRGLEGGADAYLTHPVEPEILVATLGAMLRARLAEARYGRVFDSGLLGIVQCDAAGKVVDANETFLRLAGVGREDLAAGRLRCDELLGAELPADGRSGHQPVEREVRRSDGAGVPVLVGWAQVKGHAGGTVAFVLDIAERKRAEEALREADRKKNDFLAMLSHELRNPLAPIRNAVAILDRAEPRGDQARRARQVIDRQVEHLTRLVEDLLDVTRVSRGKIQLQRARVDLTQICRHTFEDHRKLLADSGISFEACISQIPVWVDGDAVRLAQMLGNLLVNAAKFSDPGSRVLVAVEREGDRAVMRVRDQGAGIAPEMLGRLFEPFVQADETMSRSRGGLGLGLALVKWLTEMHGGTAQALSDGIGRGAEFTIRLPLSAAPAPAPAPSPGGEVASPRRVLVIEDNEDAADSLRELLEFDHHQVKVAHTGRAGIEVAREFRPDVVLCDLGLPEMDGYEVARRLRTDVTPRHPVLVALSGYASPEDQRRATEAGFQLHLGKPASWEQIEKVLALAGAIEAP
jgi:PAS domain S-box-containing protein